MAVDFFTTEKRTLGVVLSNTTPPLRVPEYQRDFSWEEQQITEFWNDLQHFDETYPASNIIGKEYFLGAAVFVNNQTFHLILDGQQRLATATILLAAIRDKIRDYSGDGANQIQNTFITFEDHLSNQNLPKLQLNEFDRAFFRDRIQTIPAAAVPTTKRSHRLIAKAYQYFADRIREAWEQRGGGLEGFKWAARITKILTDHVSLVTVISADEDNAASIFETLNDRGIGLSTADLLRSWLLHRSAPAHREEIIECWSDVFESGGVGDAAASLIRLSWLSRYGDVKERSLYKIITRHLTSTNTIPVDYCRQLRSDALFYKRVREGDSTDITQRDAWMAFATLRAQSGYTVLLAAHRTLSVQAQKRLSLALLALIVRYNIICDKDRAKFESTAFTVARTISDGGDEASALALLRALSPSDDEVRNNFLTLSLSRAQTSIAQVILRAMEYQLRATEELIIATPEKVHLEHVYPQKPATGERIANHDELVGRLGNLTLLDKRLNQEASNSPFITKRDDYYRQSEMYLTKELLGEGRWTQAEIETRQRHLCDLALRIWPHSLVEP
jgi:hypothetical protein